MVNNLTVTMVRLYIPESSHSARKTLMDKVLHLLHDQLRVHGITILTGMSELGSKQELHYEGVGDLLRRHPDPPLLIEFFDESPTASEVRRLLRELVPASYAVYWPATWEMPMLQAA